MSSALHRDIPAIAVRRSNRSDTYEVHKLHRII